MSLLSKAFGFLSTVVDASPRLDSIQNAVTGLGTQEDNATYGRPTMNRRLDLEGLMTLYATSDLAQRIVDEIVDDAMRQGYIARDDESNEEIEEPEELDIRAAITEALKEARLLGGAGVMLVLEGVEDYSKPLDLSKKYKIQNLLVLDRTELQPVERNYDYRTPGFGQPTVYQVSPRGGALTGGLGLFRVHTSYLLLFRGQRLPKYLRYVNDEWDDSVLQAAWDRIRNFEQVELSMGNIVQRFEIATYSIDNLGEILESVDGREKILQRLQLIQRTISMVRAVVLDKQAGESYDRSFTSVNGLDTIWDRLAHSVAKSARMSMTQLFGAAPSGLATDDESGRANWRKQNKNIQTRDIGPALERYYRILNEGRPVKIVWAALDEATAMEEATIQKLRAETREVYTRMGAAVPQEFREHLVREGVIITLDPDLDELGDADVFNPDEDDADPNAGGDLEQGGDEGDDGLPEFEE